MAGGGKNEGGKNEDGALPGYRISIRFQVETKHDESFFAKNLERRYGIYARNHIKFRVHTLPLPTSGIHATRTTNKK